MKDARINKDTGRLDVGKGQTEQEHSDPVGDIAAEEAGRPDRDERLCGGKHGDVQE